MELIILVLAAGGALLVLVLAVGAYQKLDHINTRLGIIVKIQQAQLQILERQLGEEPGADGGEAGGAQ